MQGNDTSALLHQQAVLHNLLIPSLPLHLLLLLIIFLLLLIILLLFLIIISFSSLYSSFSSSFRKFGKPPRSPPCLQGPEGQALEGLHTGLVSSPQVPK